MLFLGNLGLAMSYWGALPLGILVSVLRRIGHGTDRRRASDYDHPRPTQRERMGV